MKAALRAVLAARRRGGARAAGCGRRAGAESAGPDVHAADDLDSDHDRQPRRSTTTATAGSGSAFTGSSAVVIAVGALVVLGGISLFIWRDARRRAPKGRRTLAPIDAEGKRAGSKPRPKPRKLSQAERRRRKRGRAR